jgi:hypothetical protein
MKCGWLFASALAIVGSVCPISGTHSAHAQTDAPSFTKRVDVDRSHFFRLIVNLAFKASR